MIISDQAADIVKATVPIIRQKGTDITMHMYNMMQRDYPEVKSFFNTSHVRLDHKARKGEPAIPSQPRTLANAILAYAENIDNLGALSSAVDLMTEKHVSFNILPEHYFIVKSCLLPSIRDVLGPEVATDDVMDAWEEAYNLLADILITKEEEVRQKRASMPGGWKGYKEFVVSKKIAETKEITSFYLRPKDGQQVVSFSPGQFIAIKIPKEKMIPKRDHDFVRNYSLSGRPDQDFFRISVKRIPREDAQHPAGIISNHLHDNLDVGGEILVGIPCGSFILEEDLDEVVLISGGVGVTPIMSMLEHIAHKRPKTKVWFIQCVRDPEDHPFRGRVSYLSQHEDCNIESFVFYSKSSPTDKDIHHKGIKAFAERINEKRLHEIVPSVTDQHVYFCGPLSFQKSLRSMLIHLGADGNKLHYEQFGPTQILD